MSLRTSAYAGVAISCFEMAKARPAENAKEENMKDLPLISVIVPVYKAEPYLNKCIQSITDQTYRKLEILLVDDGSPDRSGEICDMWAAKDSRIKVFHKENGGGGLARNVALDAATGDLIAFVDSDDYIAPDMFAYLYSLMDADVDIAECAYVETYDDNAVFSDSAGNVTVHTPESAMYEHIQDTVFRQLIWNKLYRREIIGDIRFPVGTKIDDEFFTYQVLGNARKLILSDRVCHAYRQQPDSVMHQKYSIKRLEGLDAKLQRLDYLNAHMPSLVNAAREELAMSCLYGMQGSLDCLSDAELEQAKELIYRTMEAIMPVSLETISTGKRKLLLYFAQRNLEVAAKLLNFLIRIHVLT